MNLNTNFPIFVLGCQRSGTSLLRRLLNCHSNIACPPESAFIVQLAKVFEIKRAFRGLQNMGFSEAEVLEQMRYFTVYFFEKYARKKGKRRWAEKTPHYLNHVDTIDRMLAGEVVYIGVVRHGLDVAYSLCNFDWNILEPYLTNGIEKPLAAIRFWQDQNTKLLDFKDRVKDRFHLIKYEDLTTKPKSYLPVLFEFLGEQWEEDIINYNEFDHDPGFEDKNVSAYSNIQPNSGKYKNWPVELQRDLYQEAQSMFCHLGY